MGEFRCLSLLPLLRGCDCNVLMGPFGTALEGSAISVDVESER